MGGQDLRQGGRGEWIRTTLLARLSFCGVREQGADFSAQPGQVLLQDTPDDLIGHLGVGVCQAVAESDDATGVRDPRR
jgi:hypothetical protein